MKVFNCPTCKVIPTITATEIKCPKCGKTAKGLNLPDTVKNWDEGKYSTKTVVKVVAEEKPAKKDENKGEICEKPAKKAPKSAKKPAKKTSKK